MARVSNKKPMKRIRGLCFDAELLQRDRRHLRAVLCGRRPGRSLTLAYRELQAAKKQAIADKGLATDERVRRFYAAFGLRLLSRFLIIKVRDIRACRERLPITKTAERNLSRVLDIICARFERGLPRVTTVNRSSLKGQNHVK